MKTIDEIGTKLAKMQAELFAASINETACSSAIFVRRFMNSEAAKRMDTGSFIYEASSVSSVMKELEEQFGKTDYGKVKYSENELYWMGYLYRYWCYTHEKTSKQVYKIIKPGELRALFFPYHSLDTEEAIERILEAKELGEEDYTKRGVEILRNVLHRES